MTTVKYFHSAMPGAPILSGTAGSRIAVLNACLVDGFGLNTADSVVVSGEVAAVGFSVGHSFEPGAIALIAGATPAGLNGEKTILTTSTYAVTFAATGIADQVATGTVTAKIAPAGWAKEFYGTSIAAYRSADVTSTRCFLRVDDTSPTNVRVVGYETMTDINTGVGPFPTAAQVPEGGYWPAANAANATARAWTLVADSKGFYLHIHTGTTSPGICGSVWGFGDFDSLKSGDAYACALFCATTDIATSPSANGSSLEYCSNTTSGAIGPYLPRSFTGLGGALEGKHVVNSYWSGSSSASGSTNATGPVAPTFPNGPDNGLILSGKSLVEPSVCLRGRTRGVYVAVQNCHTAFNWRDKIDGQGDLLGRQLLVIKCGGPASSSSQGVVFADITGPW